MSCPNKFILAITSLPGGGKSFLAKELVRKYHEKGHSVGFIDDLCKKTWRFAAGVIDRHDTIVATCPLLTQKINREAFQSKIHMHFPCSFLVWLFFENN